MKNKLQFIYTSEELGNSVNVTWSFDEEDENAEYLLEKFKQFLLALSYYPDTVNAIQYLKANQLAKLSLLGDNIEE